MQYRFDFMQHDYVPPEHLERDKQLWMQRGIEDIGKAILRDYNYSAETTLDGKVKYSIELTILNGQRFRSAIRSIDNLLIYHPNLQGAVEEIFRQLDQPDIPNDRNSL